MKQTIEGVKRFAERTKLVTALLALFMSGALIATTLVVWYYDRALSVSRHAQTTEVGRLQADLDHERNITRSQLNDQAKSLAQITADVERMWALLESTAETASSAASTAQTASETASGAASTARGAASTIKEVVTRPDPPVIRERVIPAPRPEPEQQDVPKWLDGN